MSTPIRVTYVYNCTCKEEEQPPVTSQPYPVVEGDAVNVSAALVAGLLFDELILTSHPYPVEMLDHLVTTAGVTKGSLRALTEDSVKTWGYLVAGALEDKLKIMPPQIPDAVDVDALLVNGDLLDRLRVLPPQRPDEVHTDAWLTAGALDYKLIETFPPPDSVDVDALLVSGELEFFP